MPHGEFDVATVQHRQQIVLGFHGGVGAAEFQDGVPFVDDRRTVHALCHQFRLKDPGGVLQLFRLLLLVDEKQRDAPVIAAFTDKPLDDDFGTVEIDGDSLNRTFYQFQPMLAASWVALPHSTWTAGLFADEVFAEILDVLTPSR